MQKKNLTISTQGIDLIKSFEGIHDGNPITTILEPKKDPVGYWTLGFGSRYDRNGREVTQNTAPITLQEATELLIRDVNIAGAYINRVVSKKLTQSQFDALCSLVFNIGTGNFQKSRLLNAINTGQLVQKVHFTAWRKARGIVLPGLERRREAEYALFIKK